MRHLSRFFSCLLMVFCVSLPASPFDTPLSDEAVREAYFLGQRHDASFLGNYIKFLTRPKTGPHISSVTFLTPFAQLAQISSNYVGNYSAQQALLDHRGQQEFVKITVEIYLTNSYGAMIPNPQSSRSASSPPFIPRHYDFWRDFRVHVSDGRQVLSPSDTGSEKSERCRSTQKRRPTVYYWRRSKFPGSSLKR